MVQLEEPNIFLECNLEPLLDFDNGFTAENIYEYFNKRKEDEDIRNTVLGDESLITMLKNIGDKNTINPWVYCDAIMLKDRGAVMALYVEGVPKSDFAVAIAADVQDIYIVQLLVSLGFRISPYAMVYAVQRRNMEIVSFLSKNLYAPNIYELFENYLIPDEFEKYVKKVFESSNTVSDQEPEPVPIR